MLEQWQCWQQWKACNCLPDSEREIVFYSEGHAYWVHFEPIIMSLLSNYQRSIVYLTSEKNDPIFHKKISGLRAFWIGEGLVRTLAFKTLKAKLCVLTVPDLENYYLKRSIHPVNYVYVFHSLVSTHRAYRYAAFDHYDSIFCCGPHHISEIRQTEKIYNLKPKNLIDHGYGRLDALISNREESNYKNKIKDRRILIAPSWGKDNLLQVVGELLIKVLLEHDFEVILRPHPQTLRYDKPLLNRLVAKFKRNAGFTFETDVSTQKSLFDASIMISDWSGAALDFALGLIKPVLFIDVPAKTNNPNYDQLGLSALEESIRSEIGQILKPAEINKAPAVLEEMLDKDEHYHKKIISAGNHWVFHVGSSGLRGAEALDRLVSEHSPL